MTETTQTKKMTNAEAIEIAIARGYAMSYNEMRQNGLSTGDYYVRSHARAVNKALKAKKTEQLEAQKKDQFSLVAILLDQTDELRVEFLAKTKEWSLTEFSRFEKFLAKPRRQRDDFFTTETSKKYGTSAYWEAGKEYRLYNERYDRVSRVVEAGQESFIAREQKLAQLHYEQSIAKLAARIEKKELDQTKLVVTSARLEMNFETTITDGEKTVRAFTILAHGQIIRPHYRYLVK